MNVLKEGDNIMRMSARTVCLRRMIRAALFLLCIICAFTGCNPGKKPDGNEPLNSGVPGTETTPGGTDNESGGPIILSESAQAYREMFDLLKLPVAENADQDGIRTAVDIDRSMGEEAYKIDVAGGELKITASGDTGIFRALSRIYTLYEDGALPEVHLDEAPDTGLRGVIEGFYGVAWTHQFRLDLMEFMGRSRLNTYIYAPKDDAKHRAKWRVLYTQEELAKLQELVDAAIRYKVKFVYAISPGLDINLGGKYETDLEKLFKKCESVYDLGVRNFALLLDDIPTLDAEGHAKLLNDFQTRFVETHEGTEDLIAITPEFCEAMVTSKYTDKIAPLLNEKIIIMWTGNGVVPPSIKSKDLENITGKLGRKMFIWWNYPVNDTMTSNLFLGPCENLGDTLSDSIVGLVSNPMNQGYASMAPLFTISEFLWDMKGYDADASLERAAKFLYPGCSEEFLVFADLMRASSINANQSSLKIKKDIRTYRNGSADPEKLELLISEMDNISASLKTLRDKADSRFVAEADPWITKCEAYADICAGLFRLEKQAKEEESTGASDKDSAQKLGDSIMAAMARIRGNTFIVSPDALTPVVNKAKGRVEELLSKYGIQITYDPEPITNMNPYQDYTLDKIIDGDDSTYFWTAGAFSQAPDGKGYIGLDLGRVVDVKKIHITTGLDGRDAVITAVVECSTDGKNWTTLASGKLGDNIVLEPEGVSAQYVRIRGGNSSESNWVILRTFEVETA